jgi:predicted naringenin-chalcone synthase
MNRPEAHIAGVGTALPPYLVSTDRFLEVDEMMRRHHGQSETIINRMKGFTLSAGIKTRNFSHPVWLPADEVRRSDEKNAGFTPIQDIFTPNDYIPPYWERMKVFEETAIRLAVEAARNALKDWGGDKRDITHLIITCTSGWREPGIAVSIIRELGLSLNCQKAELNFNGCFCGATCLRMGNDAVRAGNAKGVLVVAVEVSSTHYDVSAVDDSSLVAHSLFADGAAAIVLAPQGRWKYKQTGMSLVPDSTELLGLYPPIHKDQSSYRMILNKDVGGHLGQYFREGLGREIFEKIYPDRSQPTPGLAVHPGGPAILGHVGKVFRECGWREDALDSSHQSLQSLGNLGAAAMLFVLARRLNNVAENQLVTMAFGPGVTVEWAVLEKA